MNLTQQTLGEYHLIELLGEGTVAQVYQAYRNEGTTRHYVALKVFPPDKTILFQFGQSLNQEMKVLTTFNHPNILPVLDFGQANGYTYLAMPLHRGDSLTERLAQAPLSLTEIAPLMQEITDALSYAHQRGVVHGAVRPNHILLDEQGHCLLTDFALAKIAPPSTRQPSYPEANLTSQSDIYAVGVLLYQLITGDTQPVVAGWQPRYLNPSLPVATIIHQAIAIAPQDRYDSIEAMQRAWLSLNVIPLSPKILPTTSTPLQSTTHAPHFWQRAIPLILLVSGLLVCLFIMVALGAYKLNTDAVAMSATATIEAIRASDKPKTITPIGVKINTPQPTSTMRAATPLPTASFTPKATKTPQAVEVNIASGMACFGSFGMGATCLTETGWQSFSPDKATLPNGLVSSIADCSNGEFLMMHSSGVSRFDGQHWTQYNPPTFGLNQAIACDNAGGFWLAQGNQFNHFHQGQWTAYPVADLVKRPVNSNLTADVAVAADGTVWLATTHSIARLVGQEVKIFQLGSGFVQNEDYFTHVVLDAAGNPWVLYSQGMMHWDGQTWLSVLHDDLFLAQDIAVDASGQVWIGTYNKGVLRFDGQNWQTYNQSRNELTSDSVNTLTVDAQGRVWVATNWGLNVWDGETWHAYFMDNAALVDNEFVTLAVSGAGPTLPPTVTMSTGSLTGQIKPEGQPVAGIRVQACVKELKAKFSGATPCADQPFQRETVTDETGNFTFTDLPRGHYVLAVSVPGQKWYKLSHQADLSFYSDERFTVQPDKVNEAYPLFLVALD